MKKVVTVHIGNEVFQMEEEGYAKIQKVLGKIESGSANGANVAKDIETRIATLLAEKATADKLVTSTQVDEVLETLGYAAYAKEEQSRKQGHSYYTNYRKLYRHPNEKVLGGVCGGLAAYFDADPVLLRILFVVLFFVGVGFLLYLILWIVVPQAYTPEQMNDLNNQRI